jgi:hypothetical protein
MGSLVLTGDTSGSVTVAVPLVAGSNTATIAAATGTHFPFTAGTSVASTSGTSIDFTSIPSWVKRITVMLNGVSTNGSSAIQIQIGSGSFTTSGYLGVVSYAASAVATETRTSGFPVMHSGAQSADAAIYGNAVINLQTSNTWVENCVVGKTGAVNITCLGGGSLALGGALDRVRITTVNGTDTFDAGSINILFE